MVANILIAIGFFFSGAVTGAILTIIGYNDTVKKELKKSGDKYIVMYEF